MLDVSRQTLSHDDINIVHNLERIGGFYERMNNPSKTFQYFNQNFVIY